MADEADLSSLAYAIAGQVIEPWHEKFADSMRLDNGRITRRPRAIVRPKDSEDVSRIVQYARTNGLRLTAKSGGHSYSGYCLNEGGLVVDLSLMKAMTLDAKANTLTVELGATWADVSSYLLSRGSALLPVSGACDTVGLAGFLLGGGYSFVSRSYGLGCDSVLSWDFVTPDGTIRRLIPDAADPLDRDLFWACGGMGGGNFGIATRATLQLHEARSGQMLAGTLMFPIESLEAVMSFYNEWAPTLPDELAIYGYIGRLPHPATGQMIKALRLQPVYNGEYGDGLSLLRPLLSFAPLATDLYAMTLPEYILLMGRTTSIRGRRAYTRSGTMDAMAFTPEVVARCRDIFLRAPSEDSFLLWMHQGGRTARRPTDATAYPHRRASYIFEIVSVWDEEPATSENVGWAYEAGEELAPYFTGAFVNYIDPLLAGWAEKYYGSNYPRLLNIRNQVDPEGVFLFQQGISSSHAPTISPKPDLRPLSRTH